MRRTPGPGTHDLRAQVRSRCDDIEEAYEFMLAYAAQGLADHRSSPAGERVREFLNRADTAMADLADLCHRLIVEEQTAMATRYLDFVDLLREDAARARRAFAIVLARDAISSQLVDSLNASIHVRALLTDIFLIDEALGLTSPNTGAPPPES